LIRIIGNITGFLQGFFGEFFAFASRDSAAARGTERIMPDLFAFDTPPRLDEPELIDDETQPYADFRASMTDVRHANRFLGGTAVVTRQVRRWLEAEKGKEGEREKAKGKSPIPHTNHQPPTTNHQHPTPGLTFLDVATGSADIPEAVLRLARQANVPVRIVGLDYSAPILRFAREQVGTLDAIRLVRGDAFDLPFADNSFDYVLCSLAFHHFGFERSVLALREMERVARRGWIVNDLRRARSAWVLIRVISTLFRMNRLTRHDGPASVLRAYSVREYRRMVEALGMKAGRDVELRGSLFYRVALVREKPEPGRQVAPFLCGLNHRSHP
jgi:ubiquinone/menaquinone biosynthesis C-methylase UbiE